MSSQAGLDAAIIAAQSARVRSTFERQLAEAGPILDAVADAYAAWEEDKAKVEVCKALAKGAKVAYAAREGYEAAVRQATAETVVSAWTDYASFEQSVGLNERARCVLERGCLMCCLSPQFWQGYISCAATGGGDAGPVYARAVRNCPENSTCDRPLHLANAFSPNHTR